MCLCFVTTLRLNFTLNRLAEKYDLFMCVCARARPAKWHIFFFVRFSFDADKRFPFNIPIPVLLRKKIPTNEEENVGKVREKIIGKV